MALVLNQGAFAEDCMRAAVIVTPLFAPPGCAAELVIDRDSLATTGSVTLTEQGQHWRITSARGVDEDRPWSRAPKRRWGRSLEKGADSAASDAPMDASDAEFSPLD